MIESIEFLLLAIPFLLVAVFVVQTMAETSRKTAWAAPAAIRTTTNHNAAAVTATDENNVRDLFAGSTTHDVSQHAAAA